MKYILLLSTVLIFHFGSVAQSAAPIKMIRTQATTKNEAGLYYAKSTEGNFSVLLPIPFNDYSLTADNFTTYGIGSKNQEGIKFSVTEMTKNEEHKTVDLDALMNNLKDPDNTIVNVKKEKTGNYESIIFSVLDSSSGAICKYVVTKNKLFLMIIEFPIDYRKKVENEYGYFFSSLRITKF